MKLKCIKSFEVSKGIFQYLFIKDVIYDTYMKDIFLELFADIGIFL